MQKKLFKNTGSLLFLGILALPLFFSGISFAASAGGDSAPSSVESFGQILAYLVQVITAIAHFLVQFMPSLWGTELITDDKIINGLRPMWVFVRNAVNLMLVLVLLFIVFANLMTGGGEFGGGKIGEWTIKQKLPKLILTFVAINFSIMGVRLLADGVYVGTIALLSVGDQAVQSQGANNINDMYNMKVNTETYATCSGGSNCKTIRELINQVFCPSGQTSNNCLFIMTDADVSNLNDTAKRNIMIAFGHYFMHLESLPVVSGDTFMDKADNGFFSLIMALAYVLVLIAVFIVLLVRVVVMWLFILLSPLLIAGLIMGLGKELSGILDKFMSYLILPLKISAAFAFTFVMISVLYTTTPDVSGTFTPTMTPGAAFLPFWGKSGWGWIWKILTIVLFWISIFHFALKDVPGMEGIIGKIKGFGEQAGAMGLQWLGNQAKIHGPHGQMGMGDAIAGIPMAMQGLKSQMDAKAREAWTGEKATDEDKKTYGKETDLKNLVKQYGNNFHELANGFKRQNIDPTGLSQGRAHELGLTQQILQELRRISRTSGGGTQPPGP